MWLKQYRKYFAKFWRSDGLIFVSLTATLVVNIIIWLILLIKFRFLSEPSPLHFNVVYGIDFVGPAYLIYQIPLVGLVIFLMNWFLARLVYERSHLFAYYLTFSSLFVQFVLLLAAISLVFVNR